MERRMVYRLAFLFALVLVGLQPLAAQQRPTIEAVPLADHVYRLTISIGGAPVGVHLVASVGADGVFLVDDHFPPPIFSELIEEKLNELSGDGAIVYVFNTHYHPDHNGGNAYFLERGAVVLAHENVRTRLVEGTSAVGLVQPGEPIAFAPRPESDLPSQTFEDRLELHFNGEAIQIVHMPQSHTDGDAVVYFPLAQVLAVGDLFWPNQFPSLDLMNGGNALGLARAIGSALERLPAETQIVSGHGPVSSVEDLRAYHQMLTTTIAAVRQQREAGHSLEEIQATGLGDAWASWAHPLVPEAVRIGFVYESLASAGTPSY